MGVTSRIDLTSIPAFCSARTADSRPEPGPLTSTSHERMPKVLATLQAAIAAWVAANGVPLRDPLKPIAPALDHDTTLPSVSVIVISVLLNDAWMWAKPWCTTRFSPRFLNAFLGLPGLPPLPLALPVSGAAPSAASVLAIRYSAFYSVFFRATAPLRGPLRVRELVRVRWPRTGRLRRCRDPR